MIRINWPLRRWLLSFLLGVALLSFIGIMAGPLFIDEESPIDQQLKDRVVAEREHWESETWQAELAKDFQREGMEIELYDASGRLLFRSDPVPSPGLGLSRRFAGVNRRWVDVIEVFRDDTMVGRAHIAHRWLGIIDNRGTNWTFIWMMLAVMLGSTLLTSVAGIWLLSHTFLTPLGQLSAAAEEIRRGNFDVTFPRSNVREVQILIGDFRRMTHGLKQSVTRQATVEEERRFFLASISHDLRSPLFSLRGRLEGIRDGLANSPQQTERYVRTSLDRVAMLERLVEDLFVYSRLDVLEQEPILQPIDLDELLRRSVEAAHIAALEKDVAITLATPEQREQPEHPYHLKDDPHLKGDPHLLERAIGNLLSNALRHTPKGGTVEVGWRLKDGYVEVWVADTGEGIPAHVLPHIFNPMYRGEPSRSSRTGGAGLGLAIAQRVAQAHGGALTAANRASGGALFTMRIPIQ